MEKGYHIIGYNQDGSSVIAVDMELFSQFMAFLHKAGTESNIPKEPSSKKQENIGLVSIQEFAKIVGMHYETIRSKVNNGTLDAAVIKNKKGGHARIDADEAIRILKAQSEEEKVVANRRSTTRQRYTNTQNRAYSLK